jgi:hypothetical protein
MTLHFYTFFTNLEFRKELSSLILKEKGARLFSLGN